MRSFQRILAASLLFISCGQQTHQQVEQPTTQSKPNPSVIGKCKSEHGYGFELTPTHQIDGNGMETTYQIKGDTLDFGDGIWNTFLVTDSTLVLENIRLQREAGDSNLA